MLRSSFLTFLLVSSAVLLLAVANAHPQQPQDPIIGIVSEPVTHSECIAMYRHLLGMTAPKRTAPGGVKKKKTSARAPSSNDAAAVAVMMSTSPFATIVGTASTRLHRRLAQSSNTITAINVTTATTPGPTLPFPPVPGAGGCIWSIYVDWLEASGIRVLPIPWDATEEKLMYTLARVNGVLLAGGILGWVPKTHDQFFKVAQKIYTYVVQRNTAGIPMVMWGTCQGFEMLNAAAAGSFSIVKSGFKGMEPLMMEVNFTQWAKESRMFGSGSTTSMSAEGQRARHYMTSEPTTLNWHRYGIPPEEYLNSSSSLNSSGLRPLSTTNDVTGRTFTSSVESSLGHPIFGIQLHPERVMFELDNAKILHTLHAIEVSEYLGNFLVGQLRSNNHTFENVSEAESLLIANYPRFNIGGGIRIYNV